MLRMSDAVELREHFKCSQMTFCSRSHNSHGHAMSVMSLKMNKHNLAFVQTCQTWWWNFCGLSIDHSWLCWTMHEHIAHATSPSFAVHPTTLAQQSLCYAGTKKGNLPPTRWQSTVPSFPLIHFVLTGWGLTRLQVCRVQCCCTPHGRLLWWL